MRKLMMLSACSILLLSGCGGNSDGNLTPPVDADNTIEVGAAVEENTPLQQGSTEIPNETTFANPDVGPIVVDQPNEEPLVEIEPSEQESMQVPAISIDQVRNHPNEPIIRAVHDSIGDQNYDDVSYIWYRNGELFSETSVPRLDKNTVRGDTVAVALRLTREDETASSVSPDVVTVNAPPRIWGAEFSPINATNRDDLTILAEVYDSDGDGLEISYSWDGFDIEGDTLSSSGDFLTNPLVVAYVTVSDGIDETSYKLTKRLSAYEEFYSDLSYTSVFLDQPVSFIAGFRNDLTSGFETTRTIGLSGMSYENGWINWTPQSYMLTAFETFNIGFESEQKELVTLSVVVESGAPKVLREISSNLPGKLSNISIKDSPSDSSTMAEVNFDLAGVRQRAHVHSNWSLSMPESFQQEQNHSLSRLFESSNCISTSKTKREDSFYCLSEEAYPRCSYGRCDGWEVFYLLFELASDGEYLNATRIPGGFECTSGTLEQCRESEQSEFAPVALTYVGNDEFIIAGERTIELSSIEYAKKGHAIYKSELAGVEGIVDVHCDVDRTVHQVEYCVFATQSGQLFVLQ